MSFYPGARRIFSSKYLNDEFNHIENFKSFIHFAKSEALKIHNKNQPRTNTH